MLRALAIRRVAFLALAMALSFCVAGLPIAAATPTLTQEEQQGKGIVESVRADQKQCASLSADEFELVGEYAMGSYLGSEATHSAMNRRMTLMMGEVGERRMHTALGYHYSGCADGPAMGWVGPVAGMMSGRGTGADDLGMVGGDNYEGRGGHAGTMMGLSGDGDGEVDTLDAVLIALAAAAVGAGTATLLMQRRQPRGKAAP